MKWEGKFIVGGQTFSDECHAADRQDAERTLKARNPTAHMYGINPTFKENVDEDVEDIKDVESSTEHSSSFNNSDPGAALGLGLILGIVWLFLEYPFVMIPLSILIVVGLIYEFYFKD